MLILRAIMTAMVLLCVAACSSTGVTTAENQSSAEMKKVGDVGEPVASAGEEGLRCRREQITGTRMTQKVCSTAAQREASARNSKNAVDQITRQSTQTGGPAGQ